MAQRKALATGSEFPPLEKDKLRLYNMRFCPFAQRVVIVLAYKNIPYENVNINLTKKPEWFFDLNPLAKVPIMQQNDVVVYESLTVCEYLDEVFPGDKVVPADSYQKAKDRMFIKRYSNLISKYYAYIYEKEDATNDAIAKDIHSGYDMMESELKSRNSTFYGGDKPMLIDFVLWPHIERFDMLANTMAPVLTVSEASLPLLKAWMEAVKALPAVRNTSLPQEDLSTFYKGYAIHDPDYDCGLEE